MKKTLSPLQDSETRSSSQIPSPFPSIPIGTALDSWSGSGFSLDPEQIFQFSPHRDIVTDPACGQETGVLQNTGSRQGLLRGSSEVAWVLGGGHKWGEAL